MAWRYRGCTDSLNSAWGCCDRCNRIWNLNKLAFQREYRGTALVPTGFRICPSCLDKPAAFLKTIILPADPRPVDQPRPPQFAMQMANSSPVSAWDQLNGRWDDSVSHWDA